MRPNKLVMNAFGPFKDTAEIDFTKFYQNGIFSLSGPTGAGKSTVFDAICFALYGKAASSKRNADNFKSHFSKDEDICSVTFTFEVRGKNYKIERAPKQITLGARGKLVNKPAAVSLVLPNNEVLTVVDEVAQKVKELLQMDFSQFSKVVLLPQGEFQNFLLAKSAEKQEILSNIFDTIPFQKLTENLREKYHLLEQEQVQLNLQTNSYISQIRSEGNLSLQQAIEEELPDNELLLLLEEDIKTREKQNEEKLQQKKTLEKEKENYNYQEAVRNNELLSEKEKQEQTLKNLEEQLELTVQKTKKIELHNKAQELLNLEEKELFYKKNYNKLSVLCKEAKEEENQLKALLEKHLKQSSKIEKIEEEIKALQSEQLELESFSALQIQLEKYQQEKKSCKEQIASLEEKKILGTKILNALKTQQEMEALTKEKIQLESLIKQSKEKKLLFQQVQKKKMLLEKCKEIVENNKCAVLASQLKEGEACPVCGALDHPQKAIGQQIDIEEISLLEREVNEGEKKLGQMDSDIVREKETLQLEKENMNHELVIEKEERIEQLQAEFECFSSTYEKPLPPLEDMPTHLAKIDQQLEGLFERKTQLGKEIEDLELQFIKIKGASKESLLHKKELLAKDLEDKRANVANYIRELEQIQYKKKLVDEKLLKNEKEIVEARGNFLSAKENLSQVFTTSGLTENFHRFLLEESVVTTLKEEVNHFEQFYGETKTKLEILTKQTKGIVYRNLAKIKEELEKIEDKESVLQSELTSIQSILHSNKIVKEKLSELHRSYYVKQKEYSQYKFLFQMSNGENQERVSFERYVLGTYFNEVLLFANMQLGEMTRGRYQMKRSEARARRGAYSGLDIEVVDTYNYTQRDISTLSGGETFLASLSLALGMSEMIGNMSGVSGLGMLFIDEGFGSLDDETLEITIGVLNRLKEQGLLIGLISHVSVIKEQIDCRVEVTPTKSGSILKTIC